MSKINILHLSDLHFGYENEEELTKQAQHDFAIKSLLEYLQKIKQETIIDIIVITGDIAFSGQKKDYDIAKPFIQNILSALKMTSDKLVICTGNHDIDLTDTSILIQLPADYKEADEILRIEKFDSLSIPFTNYINFYNEVAIPSYYIGDKKNSLCGIRNIDGIEFLSLNSAWFCRGGKGKGDRNNIWLGKCLLEYNEFKKKHNNSTFIKIAIFHHPPEFLSDSDRRPYNNRKPPFITITEEYNLILTGHAHAGFEDPDEKNNALIFFGGATYNGIQYENNFSLYEIDFIEGSIKRNFFEFSYNKWQERFTKKYFLRNYSKKYNESIEYFIIKHNKIDDYIPRNIIFETDYNSQQNFLINKGIKTELIELIKKNNRILLIGDAGSGKSTELKYLAWYFSNEEKGLNPIFIKLNTYIDEEITHIVETTIGDKVKWKDINNTEIIILLDGYDEIQDQNRFTFLRRLQKFTQNFDWIKIILTSRINFYQAENLLFHDFQVYAISDLNAEEINNYIVSKLKNKQHEFWGDFSRFDLKPLLAKPFYLVNIIKLFQNEQKLSDKLSDIMENLLILRIESDKKHFLTSVDIQKSEKLIINELETLAIYMEMLEQNNITLKDYNQIILKDEVREKLKYFTALRFFNNSVQFEHNNFQEYLAARFLLHKGFEFIKKIISYSPDYKKIKPSWVNTISFLINMYEDNTLVNWILEIEPEILVLFEFDRIPISKREIIFKEIFNIYKSKKIAIPRNKFPLKKLANFSNTEATIDFLMTELYHDNDKETISNAINILGLMAEYTTKKDKVIESLIDFATFSEENSQYIQFSSLVALSNLNLNSKEIIEQITSKLQSNINDWIKYGLYYFIHTSNFVDDYIDFFLDGIKLTFKPPSSTVYNSNDTRRLINEMIELSNGLRKVKSLEGLNKILSYFEKNIEYVSEYTLRESLKNIIENSISAYKKNNDDVLYKNIFNLFIKTLSRHYTTQSKEISIFFRETKTLYNAFILAYALDNSNEKIMALAYLMDENTIFFLTGEYLSSNIEEITITYILNNLNYINKDFHDKFRKFLNTHSRDKFPETPERDFEKERKEQNENEMLLLINKPKLIGKIKIFFEKIPTFEFTNNDLYNIVNFENEHERFMIDILRDYISAQLTNKGAVIDYIEKNFDFIIAHNLYKYFAEQSASIEKQEIITWISKWFENNIEIAKFKTAITVKGSTTSFNQFEIILYFFMRKYNLKCSEKILLDTLSYIYLLNDSFDIFEYVEIQVGRNKINDRVFENLKEGITSSDVLKNHFSYCMKYKFLAVLPYLINTITNTNRTDTIREIAMNDYYEIKNDLNEIENLLDFIKDDFKFKLYDFLIINKSNIIENFLLKCFHQEDDHFKKYDYSKLLIRLNNITALQYYVDKFEEVHEVSYDSFYSSPLVYLKTIESLPYLIKLFYIGYVQLETGNIYHELITIIQKSLLNISSISPDAYNEVKKEILKFIEDYKEKLSAVKYLDIFIESLDNQYYSTYSGNKSIEEIHNLIL